MLNTFIEKLIDRKDLTRQESQKALEEMLLACDSPQTAAFLVLMRAKGETAEELTGIIEGMRKRMVPVHVKFPVLDIVGTGGDKSHTVNISTGSSILAASCGVKVAKHGNRSVSSLCGSADVLEALGMQIDLSAEQVAESIENKGIGFMFAPNFHPAMMALRDTRKKLQVRTLFNLIGPLLNPAGAQHQMIGVFNENLVPLFAQLLQRLGTKRSLVFHGNGLDELSCMGPAKALEVTPDKIEPLVLDPRDFGFSPCTLDDLKGGKAQENAQLLLDAFQGKEGEIADTLAFNAGAAIKLYGIAQTYEEGITLAKRALKEGAAEELLAKWRSVCTTI